VWLIFIFAALLAGGATVDKVTRSAIVPALAGDRLRAALSITFGLYQVAAVVGPALGGLMIAALGTGSAYAAQAIGFLIMIGVTSAHPRHPPAPIQTCARSARASRSCAATAR
jgi:predicted MFS family arabinose efflux permease